MIYPLANWQKLKRGYLFKQKTFYSPAHLGLDLIVPVNTPIFAWQNLTVIKSCFGVDAGYTAFIKVPNNKRLFRLIHLEHLPGVGSYKEGEIFARSGKSGKLCKGAHLHIDISKNGVLNLKDLSNFEDPELYFNTFVI